MGALGRMVSRDDPSAASLSARLPQEFYALAIAAARTAHLNPLLVRRALSLARQQAKEGQIHACLYYPKAGAPLVILKAEDLGELLEEEEAEG